MTLTFTPELGEAAALFPKTFGDPYREVAHGVHTAPGRSIRVLGRDVEFGMETKDALPPEWDGGVQDALLKAIATELLALVARITTERWTKSPFEEPPAKVETDPHGFLLYLTNPESQALYKKTLRPKRPLPPGFRRMK